MSPATRPARAPRLSRREYAVRRRCLAWGVPYTRVSRAAVFARSSWVCQLCGRPVHRDTRYPHPMSASLDHIVPLSQPGSPGHVLSNCQLAHLGCNSRKGGYKGNA